MCKASCTYISYYIKCLFTMFLLNVQPIGFGLKRACTSLQAVCMIMVYFTEHLNHLLCFFDQESWLIRAAYFTYIYSWGKLCNHKCPHSFICLESFSHEKRISNSFNRRFCLSVRMQPATSATPFLLFFAGLHVRWHHFSCEAVVLAEDTRDRSNFRMLASTDFSTYSLQ